MVSGGTLGTSADWYWYSGSCGGMLIGNGAQITINPTVTTNYYVRAEGVCNTTACVNVTVTVNDSSVAAISILPTMSTICQGMTTMLGVDGGIAGTMADWYWYTGSCGGTA